MPKDTCRFWMSWTHEIVVKQYLLGKLSSSRVTTLGRYPASVTICAEKVGCYDLVGGTESIMA